MTDMHWISDRAGVGVFEDETGGYGIYIDAQHLGAEYPITRETYEMITDDFINLRED